MLLSEPRSAWLEKLVILSLMYFGCMFVSFGTISILYVFGSWNDVLIAICMDDDCYYMMLCGFGYHGNCIPICLIDALWCIVDALPMSWLHLSNSC